MLTVGDALISISYGVTLYSEELRVGWWLVPEVIALFWVVVPNVAAYWFEKDVAFTTLVYTVGLLGRRLPIVAGLTAALLTILLIHLALYPWPSAPPLKECSILP